MNLQSSDAIISYHSKAASVISGILADTSSTTVIRITAITAIIDAINLSPENLKDSTSMQEVMGITTFVLEPGIQNYIESHINSTDFPIHPVLVAIYLKHKNPNISTVQVEKHAAVNALIGEKSE